MADVHGAASEFSAAALISFACYLLLIVWIGVRAARFSSAGVGNFYLAGRRLGRYVVALSAVVSGRSAWLLIGFTGMAYARGASAIWAAAGYISVEALLFVVYAPRLRRFSGAYDCITLPDFFAARFGSETAGGRILRFLTVSLILIFMVTYVAAQFVAGGKSFATGFGFSPTAGLLLTAAIVLVYTVLGGFLAASLTDVAQAVLMIGALVVLPVVAISRHGGWGAVAGELASLDPTLLDPLALSLGVAVGFIGIGLGSPGNPHVLVRYMSIDDPRHLRISAIVGTGWNIMMAAGALFVGLVGRAVYPDASLLPAGDTENLYPALAQSHLPPVLFGLVIASIFAAIMSTADSQLLVAASGVVRDVWQKLLGRGSNLGERRTVAASRAVVIFLVVVAVCLGMSGSRVVFWLVLFSWAGLGASIGPTSILALFWSRTTAAGVAAGMLCGAATVFVWASVPELKSVLYELVPGFAAGLASTVAVSLLTRAPGESDSMFQVMRGRMD
jgi:SSS family solute:Na+ symporter